jgi:hypothetical protein
LFGSNAGQADQVANVEGGAEFGGWLDLVGRQGGRVRHAVDHDADARSFMLRMTIKVNWS